MSGITIVLTLLSGVALFLFGMKAKHGVTEQLKSENQMQWVGMMNNIRQCAEEVVLRDIVYV